MLIRNARVSFKSCLRQLHPIYLGFIDKYLNEMDIDTHDQEKVKDFIVLGGKLFPTTMLLDAVKEKLKENKVDLEKYNISLGKGIN
jgi:hypothetical protein